MKIISMYLRNVGWPQLGEVMSDGGWFEHADEGGEFLAKMSEV
jgi:hypothetical protein